MPAKTLRPPLGKPSRRTPKPARAARSIKRIGRQALIERRDVCMTEIKRLGGDEPAASGFLHKARQLLTRHWWSSSWRARTDILRSAEWLVGIGRRGAVRNSNMAAAITFFPFWF